MGNMTGAGQLCTAKIEIREEYEPHSLPERCPAIALESSPRAGRRCQDGYEPQPLPHTGEVSALEETCSGAEGGWATTSDPPAGSILLCHDPYADPDQDGVTDAARLGVPGMDVPWLIPRLPGLSPSRRWAETAFAIRYQWDPESMVSELLQYITGDALASGQPPRFHPEIAKTLAAHYSTPAERASNDMALQQTATALCKLAFQCFLAGLCDNDSRDGMLITAGGYEAGCGLAIAALRQSPAASEHLAAVAVHWDASGVGNACELPWVIDLALEHGLRPLLVIAERQFPRAVSALLASGNGMERRGMLMRAERRGHMADVWSIADSYAVGADNLEAVQRLYAGRLRVVVVDLDGPRPRLRPPMEKRSRLDAGQLRHLLERRVRNWGNQRLIACSVDLPRRIWAAAGPVTCVTVRSPAGA